MNGIDIELRGVAHGAWLKNPVIVLYRLGLKRLAWRIAERFIWTEVYIDGRYLFAVGLERPS